MVHLLLSCPRFGRGVSAGTRWFSRWQHGRSFAAKGRGGSSIGLTRPSILFPFFLFGLRVGCERFHVVVLLRGGVEKKRREGQTVSSQRPCHVSHSSQRNRWTPLAFPKTASTSVLSQLRHVPCPSWHLHHNSTLLFPRHGMKCSLHIPPPIFLPSRQARKGPPFPCFHGCMTDALQRPRRPRRPRPRPASPCSCRRTPVAGIFIRAGETGPGLTLSLTLLNGSLRFPPGGSTSVPPAQQRPPCPAPLAHFGTVAVSRGPCLAFWPLVVSSIT